MKCCGWLALLLLVLLIRALPQPQTGTPRDTAPWHHSEAVRLLKRAETARREGRRTQAAQSLARAADHLRRLSELAASPAPGFRLSQAERKRLRQLSEQLAGSSGRMSTAQATFDARPYLDALAEVGRRLDAAAAPEELSLKTTYAGPKVVEGGGGGGHATAMGPAPPQVSSLEDIRAFGNQGGIAFDFEERSIIAEKIMAGGSAKDHILETGGAGVALFDYDNDGLLDIFIVNAFELTPDKKLIPHRNILYHNLGNWKFENVSRQAGVDTASWGYGVCAGDYNNDGYLDLYVTNYGANFLFRNNGDGTFTEVAAHAGVNHSGWSTGCSFFDADGDGNLDLYVAGYVNISSWDEVVHARRTRNWMGILNVMAGPVGLPGAADVFYHNEGDGTFTDRTRVLGLPGPDTSYGFGILTTDYNDDGFIDVFVANDSNPHFLFRNRGNGEFDEVGLTSGIAFNEHGREQAGMGVDGGDFDGDGLPDIVVSTFIHDTKTLYRNMGKGMFRDVSELTGLYARTFQRLSWGISLLDADLDGALDLFIAYGHLFPQIDAASQGRETFGQKNQLLVNRGGRFKDVSEGAGPGLQIAKSSRGLAVGDLDNDGDLDIVVTNIDDVPTVLENRTVTPNHWALFKLTKAGGNRFCIGAKVVIDAGGRKQVREIRSGGSYLSQSDLRAHFGLGSYSGKLDAEVRMPGGERWRWKDLAIDRITTLTLDEIHRVKR